MYDFFNEHFSIMKFVPITHDILFQLYQKGYNVLRSTSLLSDQNPTFYPDTVNIDKVFNVSNPFTLGIDMPMQEKHLLIIQEGLLLDEQTLIGVVFVTEDDVTL